MLAAGEKKEIRLEIGVLEGYEELDEFVNKIEGINEYPRK